MWTDKILRHRKRKREKTKTRTSRKKPKYEFKRSPNGKILFKAVRINDL